MAVNMTVVAAYLSPNSAQRLYPQITRLRIPLHRKITAGGGGGISGGGISGGGGEGGGEGGSSQGEGGGERKWYLVRASSSDFESWWLQQQQQQKKRTDDLLGLFSDAFKIGHLLGDNTQHHHHHGCDMSSPVVFKQDDSAMVGFGVISSTLFFAYLGLRDLVEVSVDYLAKLLNKRYTKHDPTKYDFSTRGVKSDRERRV